MTVVQSWLPQVNEAQTPEQKTVLCITVLYLYLGSIDANTTTKQW